MTKYRVEVYASSVTAIYFVEANSPEEAEKKTYDRDPDEYDWSGVGETKLVEREEE